MVAKVVEAPNKADFEKQLNLELKKGEILDIKFVVQKDDVSPDKKRYIALVMKESEKTVEVKKRG